MRSRTRVLVGTTATALTFGLAACGGAGTTTTDQPADGASVAAAVDVDQCAVEEPSSTSHSTRWPPNPWLLP